jgi:hypothetical protein
VSAEARADNDRNRWQSTPRKIVRIDQEGLKTAAARAATTST